MDMKAAAAGSDAVVVRGLVKHFLSREGLPVGWGFGDAHWIVSSIIKYRKKPTWSRAVDGVDLTVRRGELLGLLGPNGAGKTTLLKCLATLLTPDGGSAEVNGYDLLSRPEAVKLSINLVGSGQWTAFDWGMTVEQNLDFFGCLYGLSRTERKEAVERTLHTLGLEEIARRTPRDLSSGERQKMLLAKGFAVRTPVFFLDEPTASLDPQSALEVRRFIRRELMSSPSTAGILTTHRMIEAESLCDRVAIMHQGKLIACGTVGQLKKQVTGLAVLEADCSDLRPDALAAVRACETVTAAACVSIATDTVRESLRLHLRDESRSEEVLALLRAHGVSVHAVSRREPGLEDVFLALTKRRLSE